MRKNTDRILEWLIKTIIFLMVMGCIWQLSSCRILKSHKSKTGTTLDSTHQVINNSKTGTRTDSTVHSDKKDSSGKQTWWNYEKETSKTVDWIWLDPVKRNYPDSPQVIKRETTITRERGQVHTQDAHQNSQIVDVDLSKIDTSGVQHSETTHVQKGSTTQVNDRKVNSIPAWVIIGLILATLAVIWLHLSGMLDFTWILALFKRRKTQDKT
jgi:hypothetical protein